MRHLGRGEMARAIIWLAGLAAFAYLVERWHMLREIGVLAFLAAALFWLLGGLAFVGKGIKSTFESRVNAEAAKLAAAARRAAEEQGRQP